MGRQRNETNEQWMDRIRETRGLPPMREDDKLMERTRAAVCYVNATNSEASKMNAFLALFHPEIGAHSPERMALMQTARERDRTNW